MFSIQELQEKPGYKNAEVLGLRVGEHGNSSPVPQKCGTRPFLTGSEGSQMLASG